MKSLIALLSHPYLVVNRIAETVYGEKRAAIQERLRSRIRERHYFTFSEYQQLRKAFMAFSVRLDQLADRMEAARKGADPRPDWHQLMRNRWLKPMVILRKLGKPHGLTQLQTYDRLRGRGKLPDTFTHELIREYRDFATWIRACLAQVKVEKQTYEFSQGTGGAGHRKKVKTS